MNSYIDAYCERLSPGLWAEPLNAVSNAAFLIAALAAYLLARRRGVVDGDSVLLLALLTAIGIGSTLFHTFAVRWAALADSLPILLFQIAYLAVYGRQVIGLRPLWVLALVGAYFAVTVLCGLLPGHWLNGSLSYLPALLFLGGLAVYHARRHKHARWMLAASTTLFTVSLTFRSLDMAVCNVLPIGVHYMWHILNGCVLYGVLVALFMNKPQRAG
ncbi:MAG: ceramidase domain-containing protein [Alphaproteobacteria bacterium]|nr:ceramidase domain-containing protein [Alphaproteobacteria bacterium]MBU0858783.1 ceramidase domain-containing protein [Alphaproteobacteria bacterium]